MLWRLPLLLAMAVLFGCRHAPPASTDTGASSFTVVDARRAPADTTVIVGEVEPSAAKYQQDYQPAVPRKGQPMPVYPARALKAKAGAATVGVRVLVDADGKPADIGPSLLIFSTPGPFADDFLGAVKAAVGQWRFHPAEILQLERVEAPGVSYNRVSRSERTETQLDLAFTFTATGGVAAGK